MPVTFPWSSDMALDRYATRCANSVFVVPRVAVQPRVSAAEHTGNQPGALQGYQGRSSWLVAVTQILPRGRGSMS
jgi:hypothetical protein